MNNTSVAGSFGASNNSHISSMTDEIIKSLISRSPALLMCKYQELYKEEKHGEFCDIRHLDNDVLKILATEFFDQPDDKDLKFFIQDLQEKLNTFKLPMKMHSTDYNWSRALEIFSDFRDKLGSKIRTKIMESNDTPLLISLNDDCPVEWIDKILAQVQKDETFLPSTKYWTPERSGIRIGALADGTMFMQHEGYGNYTPIKVLDYPGKPADLKVLGRGDLGSSDLLEKISKNVSIALGTFIPSTVTKDFLTIPIGEGWQEKRKSIGAQLKDITGYSEGLEDPTISDMPMLRDMPLGECLDDYFVLTAEDNSGLQISDIPLYNFGRALIDIERDDAGSTFVKKYGLDADLSVGSMVYERDNGGMRVMLSPPAEGTAAGISVETAPVSVFRAKESFSYLSDDGTHTVNEGDVVIEYKNNALYSNAMLILPAQHPLAVKALAALDKNPPTLEWRIP